VYIDPGQERRPKCRRTIGGGWGWRAALERREEEKLYEVRRDSKKNKQGVRKKEIIDRTGSSTGTDSRSYSRGPSSKAGGRLISQDLLYGRRLGGGYLRADSDTRGKKGPWGSAS